MLTNRSRMRELGERCRWRTTLQFSNLIEASRRGKSAFQFLRKIIILRLVIDGQTNEAQWFEKRRRRCPTSAPQTGNKVGQEKVKRGKETTYEAKTVTLAGRRYIVCRNHQEAEKDAADRAVILAALNLRPLARVAAATRGTP